jgi:hypothetical protein
MSETTELMKRPSKSDSIVKRRAWELFMPAVKRYLGNEWSDTEAPHIEKQITDVLRLDDGYAMARSLERDGWEEDRGLVDLMDEGESFLSAAHKELLGQWIAVYRIAPSRKIGDRVGTTNWYRKGQIGIITKIREDEATYAVNFPDQPITSAQILLYEEVIDTPEVL